MKPTARLLAAAVLACAGSAAAGEPVAREPARPAALTAPQQSGRRVVPGPTRVVPTSGPQLVWARAPSETDIEISYPIEAAVRSMEGRVVYLCRISRTLTLEACQVESESPPGEGFGEAGLGLTQRYQLASGLAPGEVIRLPIRFILDSPPEPREFTDECAGYAVAVERTIRHLDGVPGWWARYWAARSRYLAVQAGEADTPDRLAASIANATERLAAGKERGWFGKLGACSLR
ncbi:hypothetical protein [Caulobacter sp. 17J80-11]|uniref:hypothetical protein n=1 Tax=Caulobacter sp. 17J80-11 TaxID=2763502 RepID=UPI001653579A|nr:hypothetical protein [Caulobacter sp. 17J80-11]MBC6981439.1 hypothetical protein [Caulobacter sp. 17J80-11]